MKHKELTAILCVIWIFSIVYGEMFSFWLPPFITCSWPHPFSSRSKMQAAEYSSDYVKVAVIADPQVMDKTSLHLPPKSLALEIAQFYTDLYMRRAFISSILPFKPDVVLFLGDYFDGGPYISDEEWQESLNRFKHIFDLSSQKKGKKIQVYYIPGNHDIGYESLLSHRLEVVHRYENEFHFRNNRFSVGKVEFVAVDAQTLDGSPENELTARSWSFIKNASEDNQPNRSVLLTHIPLYRPDSTSCGPLRNSPIINQRISRMGNGREITYQNYVTEESSTQLLDLIKPVLVLSGHDHDQCTVTHESKSGRVIEQTVGTISWQMGNLYPSFMLLSASNSTHQNSSHPGVFTQLCFLPFQAFIYIWYLSLFVLTLLALLVWPTSGLDIWNWCSKVIEFTKQMRNAKEKNEDLDCEYEMIWAADGTMHLVKKAPAAITTRPKETNLLERGNAVMRPTARKYVSHEIEVDVIDPTVKPPSRIGKSRTKFIVQRLLRTFRMVSIIAAVNVPLYMMLLFKDWIEQ